MSQSPQEADEQVSFPSDSFGRVPKDAEHFGTIPKAAESFRTVPHVAERKEGHTLTVREVARMFEAAGVARTERSITNWRQINKAGVARLDNYFDPNERRYYITEQSVELAIAEEKAKGNRPAESDQQAEPIAKGAANRERPGDQEIMDLKITNRVKDQVI